MRSASEGLGGGGGGGVSTGAAEALAVGSGGGGGGGGGCGAGSSPPQAASARAIAVTAARILARIRLSSGVDHAAAEPRTCRQVWATPRACRLWHHAFTRFVGNLEAKRATGK